MQRRVLVVSHEASRTGAPKVAIDVLRSVAESGYSSILVARWGGSLSGEMREVADRSTMEPLRHARVALRRQARLRRAAVPVETAAAELVLRRYRPALVWANTVLSACYVRPALKLGIPVVLHVHELEPLLSSVVDRYGLRSQTGQITWVACSDAVADAVAAAGLRPRDEVRVFLSRPDLSALRVAAGPAGMPRTDGRIDVLAVGLANVGKGVDVFAAAADAATRVDPALSWRWLGKRVGGATREGAVDYLDEYANPAPVIASADIVVQPSRSDAFPLSVVEAMALGKPIVASAVGGIPAQLGDSGVLIPPDDPQRLADEVLALAGDPLRRAALGRAAAARAEQFFDAPRFRAEVRGLLAELLDGVPSAGAAVRASER